MSKKNGETSTFEMETRETFDKIILAINGLRQDIVPRLDKIEAEQSEIRKEFTEFKKTQTKFNKYVEVQFEAVRQGLVQNYQEILQIQKDAGDTRLSIVTVKSMVSELNERVYQMSRTTEKSLS